MYSVVIVGLDGPEFPTLFLQDIAARIASLAEPTDADIVPKTSQFIKRKRYKKHRQSCTLYCKLKAILSISE